MTAMAATSLAAHRSVTSGMNELEERVAGIIEKYGEDGCISDDVRKACPGLSYSSVTARFSALEEMGIIVRDGTTRLGDSRRQQQVMRHARYAYAGSVVPIKRSINPFTKGVMFAAEQILKADPSFKGTLGAIHLLAELKKLHRR